MADFNLSQINTGADLYNLIDEIARNNADMCAELISRRTLYEKGTITLESGWEVYGGATPVVKRQGNVVYLHGAVKPTETVTLNATGVDIGQIDDADFYPTETAFVLCQGSGTSFFFLRVQTDGKIHLERLRDVGNANGVYTQGTASMWFPFSVSWIK